jgi:DNA-binding transcriptional LysR family regulator
MVDSQTGHVGPKLALETLELLDQVALRVAKFSVLPYLVLRSELVTIVPAYVGHAFAEHHAVRLLDLPIPLEPLEIALYARPEASRTPAQRWLVGFLRRHLAAAGDP